ncbi:helix-turn-helix domain-containing protein [Flavihumibacter sp. UBA7668]|uniref:helix-turn-helix domain-containing protein n=1 Tax=Flavihumibacter sp. UBA7668 TaxID=1946542 RepID=UPI0025C1EB39|nr:AraC family transcriptional regulator [Flavihumibacter sp. UBA7668]
MLKDVLREITPLNQYDCYTIFSRHKAEFTFPLHNHEEMELNLIINASGTQRIIGDHIDTIDDMELVLIGPNLPHGWFTHQCTSSDIHEVTIQFNKELLCQNLLQKNQLIYIRKLFDNAKRGVLFDRETAQVIAKRILRLEKRTGFDSILELFSILHDLSIARNTRMLSDVSFTKESLQLNSRRLERVFDYMHYNFQREISLAEVARIANMPEASFSRFIKLHTGYTFTDSLTEIRLGHVSRMLIDTTHSIAEIAFKCGFNNLANFNRIFKLRKGCTPKEFKRKFNGQRVFV